MTRNPNKKKKNSDDMFRIDVDDFEYSDREMDVIINIVNEDLNRFLKQKTKYYPEQPIHELIEERETSRLIVEMPGIEYKDIIFSYDANKQQLNVSAESKYRFYHTFIYLKRDIVYANRLISFKNGILEIIFPVKKQE